MQKASLGTRKDGKTRLTVAEYGDHKIRVVNTRAAPYRDESHRARAWQVISLMNGITVAQAHAILKLLEPNIQGYVGRPIGWLVDAIDRGLVEVFEPG